MAYNLLAVDFMSPEAIHASLMRVSAGLAADQLQPLPLITHGMGSVAPDEPGAACWLGGCQLPSRSAAEGSAGPLVGHRRCW